MARQYANMCAEMCVCVCVIHVYLHLYGTQYLMLTTRYQLACCSWYWMFLEILEAPCCAAWFLPCSTRPYLLVIEEEFLNDSTCPHHLKHLFLLSSIRNIIEVQGCVGQSDIVRIFAARLRKPVHGWLTAVSHEAFMGLRYREGGCDSSYQCYTAWHVGTERRRVKIN